MIQNGGCEIRKGPISPATKMSTWVIRLTGFVILKGVKVEPGTQVGKPLETKQEAVRLAAVLGLTVLYADRDW